jgi:hypothetical protein
MGKMVCWPLVWMRIGAAPPLYKMQSIGGSFVSIFVLCLTSAEYFSVADPGC